MRKQRSVTILLSTFNGERFVEEQLESIWAQSMSDFKLVVRDDGSSDETMKILRAAERQHPDDMLVWSDDGQRLGAKESFARLLEVADTPYVAFSDQDDRWVPQKLQHQLEVVRAGEDRFGADTPILCCSDAVVTDAALNTIAPSYFDEHRIDLSPSENRPLPALMLRNHAIGATTMMNIALARRARPVPPSAVMHDWWCALIAAALGQVLVIPTPLVHYRQHGANVIGSRPRSAPANLRRLRSELSRHSNALSESAGQCAELLNRCGFEMRRQDKAAAEAFASVRFKSGVLRMIALVRSGVLKRGAVINTFHLLAALTSERKLH